MNKVLRAAWQRLRLSDMFDALKRGKDLSLMVLMDNEKLQAGELDEIALVARGQTARDLYQHLIRQYPRLLQNEPDHPMQLDGIVPGLNGIGEVGTCPFCGATPSPGTKCSCWDCPV